MSATATPTYSVGDRVSYEDMANPYQEGTVTEIVGTEYRVAFEEARSRFTDEVELEARETVSDMRQRGWKRVEAAC